MLLSRHWQTKISPSGKWMRGNTGASISETWRAKSHIDIGIYDIKENTHTHTNIAPLMFILHFKYKFSVNLHVTLKLLKNSLIDFLLKKVSKHFGFSNVMCHLFDDNESNSSTHILIANRWWHTTLTWDQFYTYWAECKYKQFGIVAMISVYHAMESVCRTSSLLENSIDWFHYQRIETKSLFGFEMSITNVIVLLLLPVLQPLCISAHTAVSNTISKQLKYIFRIQAMFYMWFSSKLTKIPWKKSTH